MPTRSCLKNIGPFEPNLTKMPISKYNQLKIIKTKNLIGNAVFSESETNKINKSIEDISEG